jgi:cation diffusion facilitator CzcD-associated flavoprotein CzcO
MSDDHVDVLIIGAGISGIGAGCRLQQHCPGKSYAILEARDAIGGTWDLFRFPGIRSDSDMYTLCYPFRPWTGEQAIVSGSSIREYVRETAREYGVDERIRFNHRVLGAEWSSDEARWTVEVERVDTGETLELSCDFLFSCTGYYRYDKGYTPEFDGAADFQGEIVHPQFWGNETVYGGKRVVVIGSGATAVTVVPALAQSAAHVTMLQRSPSYIMSLPATDPLAGLLGRVLPSRIAYPIVRWKNALLVLGIYGLSKRWPGAMRRLIRRLAERRLPPGYDLDTHLNPSYEPWDQRMCLVPDGDLFDAISDGRVSIVTDRIEHLTEDGIALESGAELEADLIVTATGLELLPFGGMRLRVDGDEVELPETLAYRGMLLSGVPNLAYSFGYINQSWTLGSDLTCLQLCRLLGFMDRHGYAQCTPRPPDGADREVQFADFTANYIRRGIDKWPHQGPQDPWRREQNWVRNLLSMRRAPIEEDPALDFTRAPEPARPAARLVA